MKNIIKASLLLFIFQFKAFSQINLVPNGSFETTTTCPTFAGQINYATGWNNVNLVYGNFTVGTPDLYHGCGCCGYDYPSTNAGTCMPKTGSGFAGTVLYNSPYPNYREYMSTKLNCAMVTGRSYTVSFSLTNGITPACPYIIQNIGAYFSTAPLTQSGWSLISVSPQCEITAYSGSTSWVTYSFVVTATSNWQYITLGSFRPDASNNAVSNYTGTSGPPSAYANYFWDDIEVMSDLRDTTINVSATSTSATCSGYATGSATASTTSSLSLTYTWMPGSLSGQTVTNIPAAIYTVSAIDATCKYNTATVSVIDPPPLVLSVDPLSLCQGGQGALNAMVSGGTPGYTYTWTTGANTPGIMVSPTVTTNYAVSITDANGCIKTFGVTVAVSPCTGIYEKQDGNGISIYPSPFNTLLNIDTKIKYDEIIITNLIGKTVKKINTPVSSIDMSDIQDGIYFISISDNRKTILTKKIVKSE